jgi:hypothetical protein
MAAKETTITLTLTRSEVLQLQGQLADSATRWHQLWRDAVEGRRPDLTPSGCSAVGKAAWARFDQLAELLAAAAAD